MNTAIATSIINTEQPRPAAILSDMKYILLSEKAFKTSNNTGLKMHKEVALAISGDCFAFKS